uniref:Hemolysin n=1 Tax=Firmicutes phage HS19 TaxID=3056397 RepID=A0AA50ADJ6_9VIRU|nr:MAG: hemolysin [Firmicutes phage HS19]
MEDLRCLISENSSKITELQSELSRQDYSIQLMQKDYEYMKKGLDNIEKQTESNFNVLSSKLDDIYNSKDEERKKQLDEIKDLKNYVVKTVIGIGIGALLLYVFPFLK